MDISAAALPPIQPPITAKDRTHPLFAAYMQHRSGFAAKLIEAPSFQGWLYQREQTIQHENATKQPEYPEFLAWMRETKAGARPCCPTTDNPGGLSFPHNFQYWIDRGRW